MSDETYLTFEEASRIVRCTTAALREYWRRHKLPTTKWGERRVLIERDVLIAHLKERSVR
jgi:Helix-turn-helix domain